MVVRKRSHTKCSCVNGTRATSLTEGNWDRWSCVYDENKPGKHGATRLD